MRISLLFDTEDPIAPEADDAARWCAEMLGEAGARGTFVVVGESARLMAARGRDDVIAALARHDIAVHTDRHSIHPTVVEYLADRDWDSGVAEAIRRERPGVESIRSVFGRSPSGWAGPGTTWGPQINEALATLGVPAVLYAHTRVPDGMIHRFAGTLAYPVLAEMDDTAYQRTTGWRDRLEAVVAALGARRDAGEPWCGVFVAHPTRVLHDEFWDVNFLAGAAPEPAAWRPPRRKSAADLAVALANLRTTIRVLASLPGIAVAGIDEMNALLAGGAGEAVAAPDGMWPQVEANLERMRAWPILPPDIDLARIKAHTRARLGTLRRAVPAALQRAR